MTEWQPIETAPMDGRFIAAYCPDRPKRLRLCVVRWEHQWGWMATPGDLARTPTHWIPLPALPDKA